MPEALPDLDDILDLEDLNFALLESLIARVAASSSWEQLVYREAEIDQVWRLIDRGQDVAGLPPHVLAGLREKIMIIHDLVGVDHRPIEAARLLSSVLYG